MDVLQPGAEVPGVLATAGRHAGRCKGGVILRVPAGGGVAARRAQALWLSISQVLVARHGQGGSGTDVQMLVLQGVPAVTVVFAGGGDLDPRTKSQARRTAVVQISGFLVLVPREGLGAVLPTTGLVSIRRGRVQGERLLRLSTEDFVGCKVGII